MPHAIPQTHATFYTHQHETSESEHRNRILLTAQSSLRPHQHESRESLKITHPF